MNERSRLGVEVRLGDEVDEDGEGEMREGKEESSEEDDGILYETPGMNRRRNGGPSGNGRGKVVLSEDEEEDLVRGDVEVDADGEE